MTYRSFILPLNGQKPLISRCTLAACLDANDPCVSNELAIDFEMSPGDVEIY